MDSSDKEGGKEKRITQAKIKDVEFFLGKEWIDHGVIQRDKSIDTWRSISRSAYQPNKCPMCKRYWHKVRGRTTLEEKYLSQSIFGGVPIKKTICSECDK
jgi:hypothetical protein